VKAGFKQTDVGVIPEEWHVSSLGMHGTTYGGLTGKTKRDFGLGAARYVTFMNVMSNVVINCDIFEHVRVEASESQNPVRLNDLLFNGSSESPEEVAFCAVVPQEVAGLYLNSFCFGYRLQHGALVSPLFLAYLYRSQVGRQLVKPLAQGSTRYNISKGALLGVSLALPPFPEQRAIAEALSDVDGLLSGLDRLIAKKRDLKQATMQQLLTGQTRLPGFHGEWEVKTLGDVARLYQPETIAQSAFTSDGYPVFGANGVVGWYSRSNHETPQITVSCRGNCGTVNRTNGPAWITGNAMVINLDGTPNVDHAFIYFALCHADLTVLVSGSGIPQIVRGPLQKFEVRFPPLDEQTAIAAVLSEMDAELAALVARREKTRDLKQGMMQELLSGRIRLRQPEALHA